MIEKITKTQAIRELANKQSILIYGNYKEKKDFSAILQNFDKMEYKTNDFDFEDWRFCDRVCATFLQFSNDSRLYTENIKFCYQKNNLLLLIKEEEQDLGVCIYIIA